MKQFSLGERLPLTPRLLVTWMLLDFLPAGRANKSFCCCVLVKCGQGNGWHIYSSVKKS